MNLTSECQFTFEFVYCQLLVSFQHFCYTKPMTCTISEQYLVFSIYWFVCLAEERIVGVWKVVRTKRTERSRGVDFFFQKKKRERVSTVGWFSWLIGITLCDGGLIFVFFTVQVGRRSSGKTSLVRLAAQLTGHPLDILTTNSAMDTTELLGGFEQVSAFEQ